MSGLTDYIARIERIKSDLPSIVSTEARTAAVEISAIMSSQFMRKGEGNNAQSITAPSSSNKLGLQSGNLYRSYLPGNENNKYTVEYTGGAIVIRTTSTLAYARIHDVGGFIRSKGKMEGFFWAKHRATNNPYYRNLALAVRKRGGVMIPARPYIGVSEERWKETRSEAMLGRIVKVITQEL